MFSSALLNRKSQFRLLSSQGTEGEVQGCGCASCSGLHGVLPIYGLASPHWGAGALSPWRRQSGHPWASPLLAEAPLVLLHGGGSRCSRSIWAFPTHHLSSHRFPSRHLPWLEVNGWGELSGPMVPNLFDNRNRLLGRRQLFHGRGWGSCFRWLMWVMGSSRWNFTCSPTAHLLL